MYVIGGGGFLLKVKLFDYEHEEDLELAINTFLQSLSEDQFVDIQYQVALSEDTADRDTVFCFSAMLVYKEQKSLS